MFDKRNNISIGVMTMHCIPNYGAIWQAYATVYLIKELSERLNLNVRTEIIDYQPINKKKRYSDKALLEDSLSSIWRFVGNIKNFDGLKKRRLSKELHHNAYIFYSKMEVLSEEVKKNELKSFSSKYDAVISGSDQVWNPYGMNDDLSFLLDFYAGNKYAYASSFGISEFPKKYAEAYSKELSGFKKVSVREAEGLKIYNQLTGRKDGICIIDPALTMSKSQYKALQDDEILKKLPKEYALMYFARQSDLLPKYLDKMVPNDIPVVIIGMPGMIPQMKLPNRDMYVLDCITPQEFLTLFDYALVVFTNSFHGIVFSLKYGKNVWIEYNDKFNKSNSRLENLVRVFGLEKNVLNKYITKYHSIDFNKIETILEYESTKCELYLKNILEELTYSDKNGDHSSSRKK